MIAVVSSSPNECIALAAICDQQGWPVVECHSVRGALRLINNGAVRVMLLRYQLSDGYSDDIITAAAHANPESPIRTIVLLPAGIQTSIESRQITLGADCVQRDPVRCEVLLAYCEKYLRRAAKPDHATAGKQIEFLGANLNPVNRMLQHGERAVVLTPREVMLVELLVGSTAQVVSYDKLYNEIIGRRFSGDTSNMRVLLAKLSTSVQQVGLTLRHSVSVISKTGYLYRGDKS